MNVLNNNICRQTKIRNNYVKAGFCDSLKELHAVAHSRSVRC